MMVSRVKKPDLTNRPRLGLVGRGRLDAAPTTIGRLGRVVVALALGGILAGALVAPASAHSKVVSSTPAPNAVVGDGPARLVLKFDSPLATSGNAVQVLGSDRSSVGNLVPKSDGAAQPTETIDLPKLAPDIYTVGWTSVSAEDGHELKQFFSFVVGAAPDPLAAPAIPPLTVGDTHVSLKVARGDVGPTTFDASVTDSNGKPLTNLQRVIFRYQPAGLDVGQVDEIAPAKGSSAQTPSFILGLTGDWQFTVIVRRAGMDDVSAPMTLSLQGSPKPTVTAVPTTTAAATPTTAPPTTAAATETQGATATVPQPTSTALAATVIPSASSTEIVATVTSVPATPSASVPAQSSTAPIGTIGLVGIVAIAAVTIGLIVARRR